MGQTLTHGIYLPDEGERNCYNGLAANWQLLDGAVGTVAEHTSQIAGKASAVHTHSKADITDFPVYGTTAGTICEGNDSRLSDARTPVAHTHGKSDVTDLFNSANMWSANQTIYKRDPWLIFKSNRLEKGVNQNYDTATLMFDDKNSKHLCYIQQQFNSASKTVINLHVENTYKNGVVSNDSDATLISSSWSFGHLWNGTEYYQLPGGSYGDIYPLNVNGVNSNLGTSDNKWKTLNGINPGALSLPDYSSNKVEPIDFSQWNVSGGLQNSYTPDIDGWLGINIVDAATNSIFVYTKSGIPANDQAYCASIYGNGSQGLKRLGLMIPVRASITYGIVIKASSVNDIDFARFYPALGNV